jgi:hypothetical protein
MRLYTARYRNPSLPKLVERHGMVAVRITRGAPKMALPFEVEEIQELAPPGWVFGMEDDAKAAKGYRACLYRLTVDKLLARFREISARHGGADLMLLCFERLEAAHVGPPRQVCHRQTFALWWEAQTGEVVEEIPDTVAGSMEFVRRREEEDELARLGDEYEVLTDTQQEVAA